METHISQKPPLPTTSSVSASTSSSSSSPSTSSIKIERVLNSASIEIFLQSSTAAAAARRLSLPPTPPPVHPSSLPLTTLLVVESPRESSARVQYRQPQPPLPLPLPPLSSTSSEHSMATTAVATPPSHVMQPFTRPIRFVANDGQPHAKRRRITAAYVTFCIPPLKPRVNQREKESLLFFFYICSVFQPTLPPHINPRPCVLRGSEIYIHVHTACLFFRSKFVHTCAFLYHQEHVLSFPNWSFVSVLVRLHISMLTCLSHLTGL